ncbi:MAG: hypothetical protein ACI30B_06445 [Paludibacteraceae bacterium]
MISIRFIAIYGDNGERKIPISSDCVCIALTLPLHHSIRVKYCRFVS